MGFLNNLLGGGNKKPAGSALPPLNPLPPVNSQPGMQPVTPMGSGFDTGFGPGTASVTTESLSNLDNSFLSNTTTGSMPEPSNMPVQPPAPQNDLNRPPVTDNDSVIGNTPIAGDQNSEFDKQWYKSSDSPVPGMPGSTMAPLPGGNQLAAPQPDITQNLVQTNQGEIKEIVGPELGGGSAQAAMITQTPGNLDGLNPPTNDLMSGGVNPPMEIPEPVQVPETPVPAPINDLPPMQDLVVGTNNSAESVSATVSEPVPVVAPDLAAAPEEIQPVTELPTTAMPESVPMVDIASAAEVPPLEEASAKEEILPATTPEVKPTKSKSLKRTFFNVIGLFGLNGPNVDDNNKDAVSKLMEYFSQNKIKVLFDSKNGLGQTVIDEINQRDLWNEGVYFMPFMSGLSNSGNKVDASPNSKINSVVYSNLISRLDYMISNSKLFIVFNSGGVNNLSQVLFLWTLSYLYQGQNKPLILFGNWNDQLESLKDKFGISDSEMESVHVVANFDELTAKLSELEVKYKTSGKPQYKGRVMDKRVEGDEMEFLIK